MTPPRTPVHTTSGRTPRRGFSLIELLVVIAIVGLLIGLSIGSIAANRERARLTVCASNLRQLLIGTLTYIDTDGRGSLPPVDSVWTQHSAPAVTRDTILQPYIALADFVGYDPSRLNAPLRCPSDQFFKQRYAVSYEFNPPKFYKGLPGSSYRSDPHSAPSITRSYESGELARAPVWLDLYAKGHAAIAPYSSRRTSNGAIESYRTVGGQFVQMDGSVHWLNDKAGYYEIEWWQDIGPETPGAGTQAR